MLAVHVLGGFDIHLNGEPIHISRRHVQQLLTCLMLERGRSMSREQLGELFWPELEREYQLTQLRGVLKRLREALGELESKQAYVMRPRSRLAFNMTLPHTLDAAGLLICESSPMGDMPIHELLAAATSYQPFVPAWEEAWAMTQRSRLQMIYEERVLRALVDRLVSERRWRLAAEWGDKALTCDANHGFEPVYVALMRTRYQSNDPKGVSDAYTHLQAALDETGQVPSRTTRELYERLLREEEPLVPETAEPMSLVSPTQPDPHKVTKVISALITHLPVQTVAAHLPDYLLNPPTPLIGRDALLKRITRDLADPHRQLITLLGIGGIGKTRLAAAAAISAAQQFKDGVWFVQVDAARSVDAFYALLAEAVRFTPYGQTSLKSQVLDYLREKSMLVVVDNFETLFEHGIDGAALIEEMCVKALGLKVLVTTRQGLQLLRETVFDVDGLDVPDDAEQPGAAAAGAVALFSEIAGRVNDGFSLEHVLPAVVHICQMVGGTPLAIEIAAALVRGMSCAEIASRIAENLDTLLSTWQNTSPRQRSLRAVLHYASSLLSAGEQRVFARASVFVDGFTQEAAGEVAGATHSILRALKDCALLRQDMSARFFMHAFVRQFSAEASVALDVIDGAREHMRRYFLSYAQHNAEASTALQSEWANLLEGMRLAHAAAQWSDVIAYADALSEPWYTQARYGDIRQGMAWALEAAEALKDVKAESRFLSHWGRACVRQGDYAEADRHFERGLALAWQVIDSPSIARILYERAQLLIERSELTEADALLDQCIEIYEELNDTLGMAESLRQKGRLYHRVDRYVEADEFANRSYSLFDQFANTRQRIPLLRLRADIARELGNYAQATNYCDDAISLCDTFVDRRELGSLHYSKAQIARAERQWPLALAEANLGLRYLREIGDRKSIAHIVTLVGYTSMDQGDWHAANHDISRAIEMLRELHDSHSLIRPLFRLGQVQLQLQERGHAEKAFEEGLKLAEQFNHPLAATLRDELALLSNQ